MSGGTNKQYTT